MSEKNEIQAFKVAMTGDPLFLLIKNDSRSRIQETAVKVNSLLSEVDKTLKLRK